MDYPLFKPMVRSRADPGGPDVLAFDLTDRRRRGAEHTRDDPRQVGRFAGVAAEDIEADGTEFGERVTGQMGLGEDQEPRDAPWRRERVPSGPTDRRELQEFHDLIEEIAEQHRIP